MSNLGTEVYSGMAEYGKIRSGISLVFVTIIALVFIIIGGYLAFRKETYTRKVSGKIEKSECTVVTRGDKKSYNCSLDIKYKVNDKEYTLNELMELCSKLYEKGYNSLDIIRFIETSSARDESKIFEFMITFNKIRKEFRNEKILMFFILNFFFFRSDVTLENISFM